MRILVVILILFSLYQDFVINRMSSVINLQHYTIDLIYKRCLERLEN